MDKKAPELASCSLPDASIGNLVIVPAKKIYKHLHLPGVCSLSLSAAVNSQLKDSRTSQPGGCGHGLCPCVWHGCHFMQDSQVAVFEMAATLCKTVRMPFSTWLPHCARQWRMLFLTWLPHCARQLRMLF